MTIQDLHPALAGGRPFQDPNRGTTLDAVIASSTHRRPVATLRLGGKARRIFEDWYSLHSFFPRQVGHAHQP